MRRGRWSSTADLQERISACYASGRSRPFVTLTYAQSLDGSISAVRGTPLRLSGDTSMTMTHELRAMHDGILVGVGTVIADNPSLTVRLVPGSSLRPVILDSNLRCPLDCKLIAAAQQTRPIILTTAAATQDPAKAEQRQSLQAAGAVIIGCTATAEGRVEFADALRKIPEEVRSVMVEGGAAIISDLLSSAAAGSGTYVDYVLLTIAPVLVSGIARAHGCLIPCVCLLPSRSLPSPQDKEWYSLRNVGRRVARRGKAVAPARGGPR